MSKEKKKIKIEIKAKDVKNVPVMLAVDIFQSIQNIIYSIGDHLKGNPPRPKGDFPTEIKKDCSLVFSDIELGSISAELQISEVQEGLPDMLSYGEQALEKTNEIIETIAIEDEPEEHLLTIINNRKRLDRIIRELDPIWPDENSNYGISFSYRGKKRDFYPRRKPIIKALLYHPTEEYEKVLQGRIIEFRVDQKRQFEIDTPEGIVKGKYSSEIEDYIIRHIGELVQARGVMSIVNKQYVFSINDENALEQISTFPIQNFLVKNDLITFKQPTNVEVEFENEQYIFSEDKLKLLVVAKTIEEGITGIKEELTSIWEDYILANEQELSGDAIEFKKNLLSLIKERD
jgi:hypothetical protein